jgi:hypothetical protein
LAYARALKDKLANDWIEQTNSNVWHA